MKKSEVRIYSIPGYCYERSEPKLCDYAGNMLHKDGLEFESWTGNGFAKQKIDLRSSWIWGIQDEATYDPFLSHVLDIDIPNRKVVIDCVFRDQSTVKKSRPISSGYIKSSIDESDYLYSIGESIAERSI